MIKRPTYVGKFQCDGSQCGSLCCKGWRIEIDPPAYQRLQALKDPATRKWALSNIKKSAKKGYQIKMKKGACPFLRESGLCFLQKNYGADILSDTCTIYPRLMNLMNGLYTEALSMTCPVARKLALTQGPMTFETVEDELTRRWILFKTSFPPAFSAALIDNAVRLIQDRRFSLDDRLLLLGFFLDSVDEQLGKVPAESIRLPDAEGPDIFSEDDAAAIRKAVPFDLGEHIRWFFGFMDSMEKKDLDRVLSCIHINEDEEKELLWMFPLITEVFEVKGNMSLRFLVDRYREKEALFEERIGHPYEEVIENFLCTTLYEKGIPCTYGEDILRSYRYLVSIWKLIRFFLIAYVGKYEGIREENLLAFFGMIDSSQNHNKLFDTTLKQYIDKDEVSLLDWMKKML